ncbi:hypothetical protein WJX75_003666 [Coccomyxa subellipsoidea]|uniref:NAD(P)-binding protein n=1 Tax=Coccomyxa subellipsoidea TaxID=248742 RepID=A0ABR2YHT5_9CHLO
MALEKQLVYAVTGASRGIGLQYVVQLLERGHKVVAAARNPDKAEGLASLAVKYGDALAMVSLDVGDPASIKAAAASIGKACPDGIDVLINNAGISGTIVESTEQDADEFRDILMINTLGPYLVIKEVLPLIRRGTKKQIVNISSSAGSIGTEAKNLRRGGECIVTHAPSMATKQVGYRASKAGLNAVTVAMAVALEKDGITVISMCPGWVATDMGNTATEALKVDRAPLTPRESVSFQLEVVDGLTLENSGSFFNHQGDVVLY